MLANIAFNLSVVNILRRLLGLEPDAQGDIFDFYQALLEATIAQARREGRYDDGITDVSGTSITLADTPQVGCELHNQGFPRVPQTGDALVLLY